MSSAAAEAYGVVGRPRSQAAASRAGPGLSALWAWALEAKGRGEGWGQGRPVSTATCGGCAGSSCLGPQRQGPVPGARGREEWDPEATARTTFKVSSRKSARVCRTPSLPHQSPRTKDQNPRHPSLPVSPRSHPSPLPAPLPCCTSTMCTPAPRQPSCLFCRWLWRTCTKGCV